ncbi:hypothetical protein IMW75_23250 [Pseudomonas gregormendelii]|uniref:Thoeris protein ThsA Macro domain-containing protein n=1 Tax=Pseudomonas gregormendelii TaxID=1628277 RepID=A0ABS3AMG3_9PSED|nr:macro domain-containing protein [Pseudomonas gregormendelii]MBN3968181.1 hypothetical protein [Pseudomonas gregormendelii]
MSKLDFFDKRILKQFWGTVAATGALLSLILIFVTIPEKTKVLGGATCLTFLMLIYIFYWFSSKNLTEVELKIESSTVIVKMGDIFKQPGLKVIAFNEYFDTKVDDIIISHNSLNGIFINRHLPKTLNDLDRHLNEYQFEKNEILDTNEKRALGKKQKYDIGTICVYEEFILAAFSKFNDRNQACLTMPEYLEFLIKFWDSVNRVYAQQSVSVPIFGSGITRIKEHRNISDEELLKIMLWTFRISEMRFKHPAKLSIIIHKDKISQISLLDLKSARNGL